MTVSTGAPAVQIEQILRISRVVFDLDIATQFYRDALGFCAVSDGRVDEAALRGLGATGGADEIVMRLGRQEIALVRFDRSGRAYPSGSQSNDLWFQHLAIVVADIDAAYARVCAALTLTPISEDGPQLLPPVNGSVRAFKFRDPDGHPLELIWFPRGQGRDVWHSPRPNALFLGIDHTALNIASTLRSLSFYGKLGFKVSDTSLNQGPAQSRLDGLANARVAVTGLRQASDSGPGLELLEYQPPGRAVGAASPNDILTDWVTLAAGSERANSPYALRDPDGHRFLIVA